MTTAAAAAAAGAPQRRSPLLHRRPRLMWLHPHSLPVPLAPLHCHCAQCQVSRGWLRRRASMPCFKVLFRTEFHCRRTRHRVAALRSHDLLHRGRSMRASMPCSKVPFRTEFHCRRTRQMLTCCAAKCLSGPSSIAKELAIEQRLLVLTICCTGERACVGPAKVRTSHARRRARRSRRASGARLRRVLCTMHGTKLE